MYICICILNYYVYIYICVCVHVLVFCSVSNIQLSKWLDYASAPADHDFTASRAKQRAHPPSVRAPPGARGHTKLAGWHPLVLQESNIAGWNIPYKWRFLVSSLENHWWAGNIPMFSISTLSSGKIQVVFFSQWVNHYAQPSSWRIVHPRSTNVYLI